MSKILSAVLTALGLAFVRLPLGGWEAGACCRSGVPCMCRKTAEIFGKTVKVIKRTVEGINKTVMVMRCESEPENEFDLSAFRHEVHWHVLLVNSGKDTPHTTHAFAARARASNAKLYIWPCY